MLLEDGFAVDTFLCLQANSSLERASVRSIPPVVLETLNVRGRSHVDAQSFAERLAMCYAAVRATERLDAAPPRYYSWFVRTRPDNVWFGDMPRVATLSPLAISLRARSFANYGVARPMSDNHMSWGWGASGNCTTPQCVVCTKEVTKGQKCLIIDDQFAAVPRLRADHYFLRRDSRPPGPPDDDTNFPGAWRAGEGKARFVAKRWLDERMLGWRQCCNQTAVVGHGTNVNGWFEAKFTRALLDIRDVGPWQGDPPIDLLAAPLRLEAHQKNRRANPECNHVPCVPPNPKQCQYGRGPADLPAPPR